MWLGKEYKLGIQQRCFLCQPVKIHNIIRVIKSNGGITFLTTDNKNRVLADNADAVIDAGTDKVIFPHHAAGKNKSVEKRCI